MGKEHLRFCLHTGAESLPSACAEVVLRPGAQRNTLPSSSATREDKVLESQPSATLQTQPLSHSELRQEARTAQQACPGL